MNQSDSTDSTTFGPDLEYQKRKSQWPGERKWAYNHNRSCQVKINEFTSHIFHHIKPTKLKTGAQSFVFDSHFYKQKQHGTYFKINQLVQFSFSPTFLFPTSPYIQTLTTRRSKWGISPAPDKQYTCVWNNFEANFFLINK